MQPILSKRVTKRNLEWRIRNLPYPIDTYTVTPATQPVGDNNTPVITHSIVVRTSNKKYYKLIKIPELERCELLPEQKYISLNHQHNTLIITVSISTIFFGYLIC